MKHILFILSMIATFSSCCSQEANQTRGYVISQTQEVDIEDDHAIVMPLAPETIPE